MEAAGTSQTSAQIYQKSHILEDINLSKGRSIVNRGHYCSDFVVDKHSLHIESEEGILQSVAHMISPVTIRAICNDVKFPNKNITGDKSL
jgi:hypothetical protein